MKIEIECLGEMCAKCERFEPCEKYDDEYVFAGWRCKNVGDCRWTVDEYSREQNERIGTIARREKR